MLTDIVREQQSHNQKNSIRFGGFTGASWLRTSAGAARFSSRKSLPSCM
jgi:hypothetical protein